MGPFRAVGVLRCINRSEDDARAEGSAADEVRRPARARRARSCLAGPSATHRVARSLDGDAAAAGAFSRTISDEAVVIATVAAEFHGVRGAAAIVMYADGARGIAITHLGDGSNDEIAGWAWVWCTRRVNEEATSRTAVLDWAGGYLKIMGREPHWCCR